MIDDGTPLSEYLRRSGAICAYLEPGETRAFTATPEPGYLWFTSGPALVVGDRRTDEVRRFAFEYTGTRSEGFRAQHRCRPRSEVDFTNGDLRIATHS